MDSTVLTNLLGQSILSDELKAFMKTFGLTKNLEKVFDVNGNAYNCQARNSKDGIYLHFYGYNRYVSEYGEPLASKDKSKDELILNEITIDTDYLKTRKQAIVPFAFDLSLGDDKELVIKKLGKKPYDKSFSDYGHCWWFRFEEFRILTALSPDFKLIWIRLMKLTSGEKRKIQLKKLLSQQNKNITPTNIPLILAYTIELPTIRWEKRKAEGDEMFTDKGIKATEILLKDYIQTLSELTKEKKATGIYSSIKKIVTALNKLNDKHDGFIETLEREELCDFINNIVRVAGLTIEANIDLTEEWREW